MRWPTRGGLAGKAGTQRRRAGDGVWRRVARPSVVNAWQARGAAREGGLSENRGREGGLARGAARGRPEDGASVTARRRGGDGVREGKTEEGERWSEGSLVNKLKFKIQFVNSVFLLFLGLK